MNKAIVVTGASTGIGRATADLAVQRGYRTFGTVRTRSDADDLARSGAEPLLMDVTDNDSVAAAADTFHRAAGDLPLAALVNNAGVQSVGPIELVDIDDVRHGFDVNVLGVIRTTQAWLPALRTHHGRIINVSSVSGCVALPFMGPYAASKFALEGLSDSLRRELGPYGVSVTVVQPGSVKTAIWAKVGTLDASRFEVEPYARYIPGILAAAFESGERGLPATRVAQAILDAIGATRPPVRVRVVRSRWKSSISRWLPARWLDRLVARGLEATVRTRTAP